MDRGAREDPRSPRSRADGPGRRHGPGAGPEPGKGPDRWSPACSRSPKTPRPQPSLRLGGARPPCPAGCPRSRRRLFSFLLAQLDREQPAAARVGRRRCAVASQAHPAQLGALADVLKTAGPLEVDRLLTAFEQSTDEALGLKLVKVLGESSALSSLRADAIKQHLAKYGPPVQTAARRLYARLNADAAKQKARIDELMTRISSGDVRRGQLVFHSEKAACYTCHAIGYRGGNIGPDLTKVGQIRSERDLLEAIVYPSASFIRSYEPVVVATADGKVLNGLLKNETSDEILLVTGANQEARVARVRHRGDPAQHRLRHARRPRPAAHQSGARRPGGVPQGVPVIDRPLRLLAGDQRCRV